VGGAGASGPAGTGTSGRAVTTGVATAGVAAASSVRVGLEGPAFFGATEARSAVLVRGGFEALGGRAGLGWAAAAAGVAGTG
jgi:hypothetical protein